MDKEQNRILKTLTNIYTKNVNISKLTTSIKIVKAFPMIRYSLDEKKVAIYYCETILANETGTMIDLMELVKTKDGYSEDFVNHTYLLEQTRELTQEEFFTFTNEMLHANKDLDNDNEYYYDYIFEDWYNIFHDKKVFDKEHHLSTT